MKTRIRQLTEQEKRSLGEQEMIADWLKLFPKGILSIVSDTFDLWKLITEYLPANKEAIMARDGKLVIRPDSGNPVDIICGTADYIPLSEKEIRDYKPHWTEPQEKGVIELLWDIFGGTVNDQGYKVLDSHIGAIYGDSINLERQVEIYKRLKAKGFAATNVVLGIGSYTYVYQTRDGLGWAAKGSWFEVEEWEWYNNIKDTGWESITPSDMDGIIAHGLKPSPEFRKVKKSYNIYKDPITDDGTKKSLRGLMQVFQDTDGTIKVKEECTWEEEQQGLLQTIYEDGIFHNETTIDEIKDRINKSY